VEIDSTAWSGEGTFTHTLIERLREFEDIALLRVEDAPSTRSDFDYNFISNEVFVTFCGARGRRRWWQTVLRPAGRVGPPAMTIGRLAVRLAETEGVGPADFTDEGMIQYLKTERIIPPYQSRGFKLVELVRIYEAKVASAQP
jgi:hypothetical protein